MILSGERRPCAALSADDIERMFALMVTHYDGVDPERFRADLADKEGVFLLLDERGGIQGFSTFRSDVLSFRERSVHYVFSGDTIIDREHWGNPELFRQFGYLLMDLLDAGRTPLYWFLLSKGIRTYGLLPLYFRSYVPDPLAGEEERALAAFIAERRYGPHYVASRGIVRFDPPRDRLKPELSIISDEKRDKPWVRRFLDCNPGYGGGDELVCLARIAPDNLTRAGRRFLPLP